MQMQGKSKREVQGHIDEWKRNIKQAFLIDLGGVC